MKIALIVIVILVVVGLLFGAKLVGIRNDLVTQREAINGQWAQVDVALRRRAGWNDMVTSTEVGACGGSGHRRWAGHP